MCDFAYDYDFNEYIKSVDFSSMTTDELNSNLCISSNPGNCGIYITNKGLYNRHIKLNKETCLIGI